MSALTAMIPCETADAMYSKCIVSPLMTTPETDDGVVASTPCQTTSGERDLEGARYTNDSDVRAVDAGISQGRARSAKQPVSDVLVEARHDEREAATGGLGRALQLFHVSEKTPGVISDGFRWKLHPVS